MKQSCAAGQKSVRAHSHPLKVRDAAGSQACRIAVQGVRTAQSLISLRLAEETPVAAFSDQPSPTLTPKICCRGENYIEVDVDVGSSRTAANVVGTVQGSLKSLVIDLAVLLEGHSPVSKPLAAHHSSPLSSLPVSSHWNFLEERGLSLLHVVKSAVLLEGHSPVSAL